MGLVNWLEGLLREAHGWDWPLEDARSMTEASSGAATSRPALVGLLQVVAQLEGGFLGSAELLLGASAGMGYLRVT